MASFVASPRPSFSFWVEASILAFTFSEASFAAFSASSFTEDLAVSSAFCPVCSGEAADSFFGCSDACSPFSSAAFSVASFFAFAYSSLKAAVKSENLPKERC